MFKTGIIGCGRIASAFDSDPKRKYIATHAGAYTHVKDTDLRAVCDINKDSLRACMGRWGISQGYSDYNQMLKKEGIEIVSVCTPPETHYSIIKDAVKNKGLKAILCEKPISNTIKDAKEIVRLCKQRNITLQIGHQRRFDPLHQEISRIIRERRLGDIQQVNLYYTVGIRNSGSHIFDLLRFFLGDAEWVEAFFSKNVSRRDRDPNLDGIIRMGNGVFVTFQACDVEKYFIFELNFLFDKGRIVLKNSGLTVDYYEVKPSSFFSGYNELESAKCVLKTRYKRNSMVNAIGHLAECVMTKEESLSSGEDGLASLELIEGAIVSAGHNGKRISLKVS